MDIPKPIVGCSYIGSKAIYRIVAGAWDRTPMCIHKHETEEDAKACEEAAEAYRMLFAPKIVKETTDG